MANRKISALSALTAPVANDLLLVVDQSEAADADKNKKITYEDLLTNAPIGSAECGSAQLCFHYGQRYRFVSNKQWPDWFCG
jgi:hypothetical protein